MEPHNRYHYPETLSAQRRFVGLPPDEFCLYVPLALLAIFCNMWIFGPTLLTAVCGIRTLKRGRGSQYLLNLVYWCLPPAAVRFFISALPESYKRHWIP